MTKAYFDENLAQSNVIQVEIIAFSVETIRFSEALKLH